jgi:2Fe-2S ferredoxin
MAFCPVGQPLVLCRLKNNRAVPLRRDRQRLCLRALHATVFAGHVPVEGTDLTGDLEDIQPMPRVIYTHSTGESKEVEVPLGQNLMLAAAAHGIDGIVGDCGGAMSCATCHVIVDETFADLLPPPDDTESQLLDFTAAPREATSRLCCQILMNSSLDGIVVRVADPQV